MERQRRIFECGMLRFFTSFRMTKGKTVGWNETACKPWIPGNLARSHSDVMSSGIRDIGVEE